MKYLWLHITTIINTYNGETPLAHFLKNYYKQNPKLGSRDRKILNEMCYSWYRCSKAFDITVFEEKIKACIKYTNNGLLSDNLNHIFKDIPDNNNTIEFNLLFPNAIEFSEGITKIDWLKSMLVQPSLFIRIRKDKEQLFQLLEKATIPYRFIKDNCFALPNGAKIDELLPPENYVVQDASSQQTGNFFKPQKNELWYDCCAGAGGKSLLLKDLEPGVRLTISDKRESIIYNLKQRFKLYKHIQPVAHLTDAANEKTLNTALKGKLFDSIICDAPCSGSGTFARTPEQLFFFDVNSLKEYTDKQKAISINVSKYLKPGGRIIYITCSVFKCENEDVISYLCKTTNLKLIKMQLINGISEKADSMFIAILQN